jgi:ADP-heptose:LPS heptosyltransferase
MASGSQDRVLVIKLGALGDFIQAFGPFAAIRRHHADARVTLLTTAPFADIARASRLFDDVWIDARPEAIAIGGWLALRRRLREGRFQRVYDLQTSDRSSFYFRLFWPGPYPEWSGIAKGCSHPHANPWRDFMHTVERQAEQLKMAGIERVPPPNLAWIEADAARFGLPARFALLIPGGAAHRPAKRWPAARFGTLAAWLAERGVQPVLLGLADEADVIAAVGAACPSARSLAGATSLFDIVALARRAALAVGNDTGPMHLITATGCPSVVLFSSDSDPALCAPRGDRVTVLRRERLDQLPVEDVQAALSL